MESQVSPVTVSRSEGIMPVPDPTKLTQEAVDRLEKSMTRDMQTLKELMEMRFDGNARAVVLLHDSTDKLPTLIDEKILALRGVHEEKFDSINKQFGLVEQQRVEQKQDTKAAVDAALCVAVDTPVLCADLIWRPAGELKVGDELVAFEETPAGTHGRMFERSVVTENSITTDELFSIETDGGGCLNCNAEHPVLSRKYRGSPWTWVKAKNLTEGVEVLKILDVWVVDRSYEAGWLAGIMDGEGCISFKSKQDGGARFSIGQVEGPVASKIDQSLTDFLGGKRLGQHPRPAGPYGSGGYAGIAQAQIRWQMDSRQDIMRLLGSLRPVRLLRHADQVWEGFSIRRRGENGFFVKSVKSIGTGLIASLSTSTKTYIAGGFASHNTAQKEAVKEQTTASERAIAKSEASTTKQLEQQSATFSTSIKGVGDTIGDLKDRLTRMEGMGQGGEKVVRTQQAASNTDTSRGNMIVALVIGVLGVLISIGSILFSVLHK